MVLCKYCFNPFWDNLIFCYLFSRKKFKIKFVWIIFLWTVLKGIQKAIKCFFSLTAFSLKVCLSFLVSPFITILKSSHCSLHEFLGVWFLLPCTSELVILKDKYRYEFTKVFIYCIHTIMLLEWRGFCYSTCPLLTY